jgi:uncharacterized sulfatase
MHIVGRGCRTLPVVVWALLSIAHVGHATEQERPNILIAISDDQSYPHASAYGCRFIETPAFDRVARQGVLFTHAFAASPGCSPSRAALLTGRYPWQLEHAGTHASSFSAKYVAFPDLLEDAGYFVGFTGKGWGPGNYRDGGRSRNPAGPVFERHEDQDRPQGISDNDYAANFEDFLKRRPGEQPFCFWYGAHEPHRFFEKGVGEKNGGKLADVEVPTYLPDTPEVRSDLLDYGYEIEWFDKHLGRMLDTLEQAGALDNTIIIVTSDNGMAFPRAKANAYEYGIHMPLAIRWGRHVRGGRVVDDLVSLIDLAPTLLEAAGVEHPSARTGQYPMSGRSLSSILRGDKAGIIEPRRTAVFSARERHSSSRYANLAYPQRCMRTRQFLYIRNFRPDRWPAGAPQKYENDGALGPMHGGYHDIDACPTLDFFIARRDDPTIGRYFHLSVDKRPAEELYDIVNDPGCLNNLADAPDFAAIKKKLIAMFEDYLWKTADPRIVDGGDIFETYKRYSRIRQFPPPS